MHALRCRGGLLAMTTHAPWTAIECGGVNGASARKPVAAGGGRERAFTRPSQSTVARPAQPSTTACRATHTVVLALRIMAQRSSVLHARSANLLDTPGTAKHAPLESSKARRAKRSVLLARQARSTMRVALPKTSAAGALTAPMGSTSQAPASLAARNAARGGTTLSGGGTRRHRAWPATTASLATRLA
jgi:hypothetical protein